MNGVKCVLIGVLLIATNFAMAQNGQYANDSTEDVLTPGARLVVGESPDVDFSTLKPGEEAKTQSATTLPHKNTPGVVAKPMTLDKAHKHLFVQDVPQSPAVAAPAAAKPPAKPSARKKIRNEHVVAFAPSKHPKAILKKNTHHPVVAANGIKKTKARVVAARKNSRPKLARTKSRQSNVALNKTHRKIKMARNGRDIIDRIALE